MEQQIVNALVLVGIYVIFSLGLNLSWGTLNVLNLAHGGTFMFAGFAGFYVTQKVEIPFVAVALLGIATAGVLTVIFELLIFRPIRRRSSTLQQAELLMLIGSIGAGSVLIALARKETDDAPFGIAKGSALNVKNLDFGPVTITTAQLLIIVIGVLLPVGMSLLVNRARFGRALRAIAYDPETCELMGVRPGLLSLVTMLGSGALAGLAGVLVSTHIGALTAQSGDTLIMKAFAVIVLAGVGSIVGVVLGATILASAETIVLVSTDGGWVDAISFAMLIIVLLLRPQGLFPAVKADRV